MKKILSALMAIVMIFTITVPAFAAENTATTSTDYNGNPVIIVRGIDFAGLTYVSSGEKALNVSASTIFSALFNGFLGSLGLKDSQTIYDSVFLAAKKIFEPITCDKEGNPYSDIVSMKQYFGSMANHPDFVAELPDGGEEGIVKTAIEKYGAENTYYFTYDWRKTPEQIATELNGFVETAKSDSGKNKVNIICASMGGMVTTAYFYYFGSENIESAVYLSGAQNGTYVCGDALNGKIVFSGDVLTTFLCNATDNIFLKVFINVFDAIGVVDILADVANDVVAESFDRGNDLMLRDSLGTFCGFWALCPDADFESGVENIFGGHEEEYAVLLEKIDGVKEFVFSTEETLMNAMANGTKVSFVSNYNSGLTPVYERANLNGDNVLETELTSNFATVAPLGETLPKAYLAQNDSKYISPDKVIDAATTPFKDYTWFVKDAPHVAADYNTGFSKFTFTLLESESQPTIESFEEYPQFMIADEFLSLSPLK